MTRLVTDDRRFPVMSRDGLPKSVPWLLVAPHESQAKINHGQSLEQLAQRGGLDPIELWRLVHHVYAIAGHNVRTIHEAEMWLCGINDLRSALVEAEA